MTEQKTPQRRKVTPQDLANVRELREQGLQPAEIAVRLDEPADRVRKILVKLGMNRGRCVHHFDREEVVRRYLAGDRMRDIAEDMRAPYYAVRSTLHNRKVSRRSREEANGLNRAHACNDAAFDVQDARSLYWAGFLAADGCISSSSNLVTLQLQPGDLSHLQQFAAFIGTDAPIRAIVTNKTYPAFRLHFSSRRIVAALRRYGVVPCKTDRLVAGPEVVNSPDWWRGMIDGDGCIGMYDGNPLLDFVGSEEVVRQFRVFVHSVIPVSRAKARRRPDCRLAWCLQLSGTPAQAVVAALYYPSHIDSLARKAERADAILAWRPKVAKRRFRAFGQGLSSDLGPKNRDASR